MPNKKTLVVGASTNPGRYSFKAVQMLRQNGYETIALGAKKGKIADTPVQTHWPENTEIHTITIYLRPDLQKQYFEQIKASRPKRIILNPGTENQEIRDFLKDTKIEIHEYCTLVLLSTGQF